MEGHTGQLVMREIVEDYLTYVTFRRPPPQRLDPADSIDSTGTQARAQTYVTWADDGYPSVLALRSCQPSKVVMDPYRAFGQPIFAGSRDRVRDVANMLSAGEDPQVVADEHGVSIEEVRTAARVLLGRAA
jgi:uncharacterized protein (DUF433 family)